MILPLTVVVHFDHCLGAACYKSVQTSGFSGLFNTKIMVQLYWLNSEFEDQQVAPRHNFYYGAKHIPLFSQEPFHYRVHLIVLLVPFYKNNTQSAFGCKPKTVFLPHCVSFFLLMFFMKKC